MLGINNIAISGIPKSGDATDFYTQVARTCFLSSHGKNSTAPRSSGNPLPDMKDNSQTSLKEFGRRYLMVDYTVSISSVACTVNPAFTLDLQGRPALYPWKAFFLLPRELCCWTFVLALPSLQQHCCTVQPS